MDTIQDFLIGILTFFNDILIPLIFTLAFFFFIWNTARYFIIQGDNEDARQRAKQLALWGIIAFVLMVSLWGIVNLLVGGLGFDREQQVIPDYIYYKTSGP